MSPRIGYGCKFGLLVNITLFNATLYPKTLPVALVLGALEIFLVWAYRESFAGVFSAKAQAKTKA